MDHIWNYECLTLNLLKQHFLNKGEKSRFLYKMAQKLYCATYNFTNLTFYLEVSLWNMCQVNNRSFRDTLGLVFKEKSENLGIHVRMHHSTICDILLKTQKLPATLCTCCVPFWNMCHCETCFRPGFQIGILCRSEKVSFWNMFHIGTGHILSYIWAVARPYFWFMLQNLAASIWGNLHSANLKRVWGWQWQNGTQCKSETCFRMANLSERHVTHDWL